MDKENSYNILQNVKVILPALNEERGIAYTIAELKSFLGDPRILVVDGKSSDNTVHVAKSLGADVVFQKGIGKGDALNFGLKCIDVSGGYIVISDADYTYPAAHIPQMIKVLDENPQVGMVCGNRFNAEFPLKVMTPVFYMGNKMIVTIHRMLNKIALKDPLTGLRVIRGEILRDWNPVSKSFDIEIELNNLISQKGFKIAEVPIAYRARIGQKKLKVEHGITILRRILNESFNKDSF